MQEDVSLVRSMLSDIREKDREYCVKMGKNFDERHSFRGLLQMDLQKANRFLKNVENKQNVSHGEISLN